MKPNIIMRKSFLYILCFVVACQLIGCGGGEEQRRQLVELEEQNHSGQPMLNDTLAETLVAYFDRHGNANEHMRAKYILGRTYADMGELPRALETYYEAADCADTTASDCDFAKLSRIHAQSADIFHKQIQPRSELKELRLAEYYAKKGKDTLMAIECYALQAGAYKYLELYDSVIFITEKASSLFNMIGRKDRSVQVLTNDISSLLKKGEITKALRQICQYEMSSGYFNADGEIAKGREMFYYLKGNCYLKVDEKDSAEFLFRKLLLKDKRINSQIAAGSGLHAFPVLYEGRASVYYARGLDRADNGVHAVLRRLCNKQLYQRLQLRDPDHTHLFDDQKERKAQYLFAVHDDILCRAAAPAGLQL